MKIENEKEKEKRIRYFNGGIHSLNLKDGRIIHPDVAYWSRILPFDDPPELPDRSNLVLARYRRLNTNYWVHKDTYHAVNNICKDLKIDAVHVNNLVIPISDHEMAVAVFKEPGYNVVASREKEFNELFRTIEDGEWILNMKITVGKVDDIDTMNQKFVHGKSNDFYLNNWLILSELTDMISKKLAEKGRLKGLVTSDQFSENIDRRYGRQKKHRVKKRLLMLNDYVQKRCMVQKSDDRYLLTARLWSIVDPIYSESHFDGNQKAQDEFVTYGKFASKRMRDTIYKVEKQRAEIFLAE